MNACGKIKRLLSRYIDKETTDAENVLIKAHLDNCSSCSRELSGLSAVKELVLAKGRKSLAQDYLVYRLREELAGRQSAENRFPWLSAMGNLSRRLIPIPAAVIVLSLVFLLLSSRQQLTGYSLEEDMLNGTQATTETAIRLILGAQN